MRAGTRRALALCGLVPLALGLGRGLLGLPGFGNYPGPYGDAINHTSVPLRQVLNTITAVNFDFRAFDTMGEEFILFVGVASLAVLLAADEGAPVRASAAASGRPSRPTSLAARLVGQWIAAFTLLFGLYVALHAHLSPGGGFQGGVVIASAWLTIYLCFGQARFVRAAPEPLAEALEGLGVGGYILTGALVALAGGAFLQNVLPLGKAGDFLSSGLILVLNACVGTAVGAGFVGIGRAFETALRAPDPDEGGPP